MTVGDWLSLIATLAATATALTIAVFGDRLKRLAMRPRFEVYTSLDWPHTTSVPLVKDGFPVAHGVWLRAEVRNVGNAHAEDVEVFLDSVWEYREDHRFSRRVRVLPDNLKWHENRSERSIRIIPRQSRRFTGIVHAVTNKYREAHNYPKMGQAAEFSLNRFHYDTGGTHLLPPGLYRMLIEITAREAQPHYFVCELYHKGMIAADVGHWGDRGSVGFSILAQGKNREALVRALRSFPTTIAPSRLNEVLRGTPEFCEDGDSSV